MSTLTHPRAYATVTGPTAVFITPDGHTEPLAPQAGEDIRHAVVRRATDEALRTGTPVELVTSGDRGEHHLLIDATGTLTPLNDPPATAPEHEPAIGEASSQAVREEVEEQAPRPDPGRASTGPAAEPATRPTFLTPTAPARTPAAGWRGVLARVGVRIPPSTAERRRAEWTGVVSRQWAGCRTIAVANGKGGVGKTMTTGMLAAVYARLGGGNVLAWDNNDTRGTLGWRTEQGLYDTTLRDLLPAAGGLLAPGVGVGVSEIARFVHHQGQDRYDVLRSNPELLATSQHISADEFDLLMQVAARYYRLVVFDSGNDESADRWLRMIDSSYQLVIPTLPNPESAESAALLLDALRDRDAHSAALADAAVIVVTQSEPTATGAVRAIADGFRPHVRAVHTVPFDPALKAGPLRFEALRPRTRDAWLQVASSAAGAL